MIDLNALRDLLIALAGAHGVTREDMADGWNEEEGTSQWRMSYKADLNQGLRRDIQKLVGFSGVCEMARRDNDTLAMRAALIDMRIYAMNVGSAFDALAEDIRKISNLKYDEPGSLRFPDPYYFPDQYREAFPDLDLNT